MNHQLIKVIAILAVIVFFGHTSWTIEACSPNDMEALISFKNGIQIDTSGHIAKWVGNNCCKWESIVCENSNFRVKEINLPGFISNDEGLFQTQMTGWISPSKMFLTSLEVIEASISKVNSRPL
ncbi:receptor protein EIX2 [Trifolium repens]|nr:receptor protein EIX2 [Trifolium repens]